MGQSGTPKVLKIRNLTDQTYVIRVERDGFSFLPGQHFNVGLVDEAINREYSSYSSIKDDYLEFLIREVDGGFVSTALKKIQIGGRVSLDGAYGLFILDENKIKGYKYMFIASGTGIAPFHSYVTSYPNLDYKLLHGIRNSKEKYDYKDYDPQKYVACVSQNPGKNDFHGRVTEYIRQNPFTPNEKMIFYLCGNSAMINDVYDLLREQGVNGSNIITEVFF